MHCLAIFLFAAKPVLMDLLRIFDILYAWKTYLFLLVACCGGELSKSRGRLMEQLSPLFGRNYFRLSEE